MLKQKTEEYRTETVKCTIFSEAKNAGRLAVTSIPREFSILSILRFMALAKTITGLQFLLVVLST